MKKLLSLFLCTLLFTATLAGCGDDTKKEDKSPVDELVDTVSSLLETSTTQNEITSTQTTTHNHTNNGEHYEGDGHDHTNTTQPDSTEMVKFRYYTNANKTYRVQLVDANNKVVFEKDKLASAPLETKISDTIVELSWATGSGANDFESIYWNKETGNISQLFWAPRGCDGTRIAYPNEDQTKIIVQDLFGKDAYYKEYTLTNAIEKNGNVIVGGKLHENKKTVIISYYSSESDTLAHATINLYD